MLPPRDRTRRESTAPTRAGYVTLVGRPNAGKSTLLNALVGEKLSIVTPKAQTTWERVTGIATSDGVQMIFLDTPGLLDARDLLQRSMLGAALEAVREADVLLVVVDATRRPDGEEQGILRTAVEAASAPVLTAVNKVDVARGENIDRWAIWASASDGLDARVHRISALRGTGIEELRGALRKVVPEGPFLYPEEDLASAPLRFFVSELIRETVFERFQQEIPWSVFCHVDEYRESQSPVYVAATVFVERASQKGILVGKGGRAIRELGSAARKKIEALVGEPVYLDLWVKVLPGWRKDRSHLRRLGFRVPEDDALARR